MKWERVPATVHKDVDETQQHAIAAVENLDRKQLDSLDEALMCHAALEQFGNVETVAATINRSVRWVQSRIDILAWPEDILAALRSGQISLSAAAPLTSIADAAARGFYLTEAVQNGASTRTTAAWAKSWKIQAQTGAPPLGPEALADDSSPRQVKPPTGLCLSCRHEHQIAALSHLPLCVDCIQIFRAASAAADLEDANSSTALTESSNEG